MSSSKWCIHPLGERYKPSGWKNRHDGLGNASPCFSLLVGEESQFYFSGNWGISLIVSERIQVTDTARKYLIINNRSMPAVKNYY